MEMGHVPAEGVVTGLYCAGPLWIGVHNWVDGKGATGYPWGGGSQRLCSFVGYGPWCTPVGAVGVWKAPP